MVQKAAAVGQDDRLAELYHQSRFEIIPFNSVMDKLDDIPLSTILTITCSPSKTIEQTLFIARQIMQVRKDVQIIPHIAARMVEDEAHLETILATLEHLQIENIFVPGGDIGVPKGRFSAAIEILESLANINPGLNQIGITGYPEGHQLISDQILWQNLIAKCEYADYIVTQMCFDADVILDWVQSLRDNQITLPVYIGIPSVVERKKLLEISLQLGIGKSIGFLKKQSGFFKQLFRFQPFQSSAQPVIHKITSMVDESELNIKGFHVFTFNQIQTTFKWWQAMVS